MADSLITWSVLADFDRDGVCETDLRPYIIAGTTGVRISRGIDPLGNPRISQVTIVLDNTTGVFSPEYSAGALYGQLVPDVLIQIAATHLGLPYTLWTGYAQSWMARGRNGGICTLTAVDLIGAYLAVSAPINVTVSTSRDTDGALVAIRDAVGLVAGDCEFDDGIQDLPYHFTLGQSAIDACQDVTRSEMSSVPVWITADGKIRFESRQSRLGITPRDTWGDGTLVQPEDVRYELDTTDLVDSVTVIPTIFSPGQADTEVFRFSRGKDTQPTADSLAITAGDTYTASWDYDSPITALTTPVASTDYLANDAADGSGTDRTSLLTVAVTNHGGGASIALTNTHSGTIYVTFFRLRGQPAAFAGQSPKFVATKSSPFLKVPRGVELRVPFGSDTQAVRDFAVAMNRIYRYPYPRVQVMFAWDCDEIKAAMLAVELGDLILFADVGTGNPAWTTQVNDWWYVEAIEMSVVPADVGRSVITLVPSYLFRNLDRCVYDAFTRADAVGDLGTSSSLDTWSGDGNMDIVSNTARANSDTLQMPTLALV